jgi:hypothetical protein
MTRRLYLQLGRLGDLLNVLPLCYRDFISTGQRPLLMVAESFASILEGVTYVEPIRFAGAFEDIALAYPLAEKIAEERGASVVCTQIYANGLCSTEVCSSFMRESWDRVPKAPAWGTLPLVLDNRSLEREAAVKTHLLQRSTGKPYVVVALSGTSSPFAEAQALTRYLRGKLGTAFDFIDVSAYIAPKFFDLLGVLEGAHCLLTIDSGPLHLAPAIPSLPVIPFITREPSLWHGSAWRPQHVTRFFYDEAPECFAGVADAVTHARKPAFRPRIWHVWSEYTPEGDTARRTAFARQTWWAEYEKAKWRPLPFPAEAQGRDSGEVGDERPMPFVSDLVDYVLAHNPDPKAIIALTNADVCFTPGLSGWILDKVPRHGAAFSHRWDFPKLVNPLTSEAAVKRGKWYPGSDAFFFTVEWWNAHRDEYPDMILGREQCDEVLRQLVKRHGGVEIPGAIYHEKHESFWEQEGSNAGNRHNRRLARQWFLRTGYGPNDPQWWKLPDRPY